MVGVVVGGAAVLVNKRELARILGVSLPTMTAVLERYPDFPVASRGSNGVPWQFDPELAKAFVLAKRDEERAADAAKSELLAQIALPLDEPQRPGAEGPSLSSVERLQQARALLAEDKLARERGFLVLTTDMRQRLAPLWAELNAALQALPAELGAAYNLPLPVVRDMRRRIASAQRSIHARLVELLPDDAPLIEAEDDEAA